MSPEPRLQFGDLVSYTIPSGQGGLGYVCGFTRDDVVMLADHDAIGMPINESHCSMAVNHSKTFAEQFFLRYRQLYPQFRLVRHRHQLGGDPLGTIIPGMGVKVSHVQVGNVYDAKAAGLRKRSEGGTRYWLVVAVNQPTGRPPRWRHPSVHALGLNERWQVVSSTSYAAYVFETRAVLWRFKKFDLLQGASV